MSTTGSTRADLRLRNRVKRTKKFSAHTLAGEKKILHYGSHVNPKQRTTLLSDSQLCKSKENFSGLGNPHFYTGADPGFAMDQELPTQHQGAFPHTDQTQAFFALIRKVYAATVVGDS